MQGMPAFLLPSQPHKIKDMHALSVCLSQPFLFLLEDFRAFILIMQGSHSFKQHTYTHRAQIPPGVRETIEYVHEPD